jgi:soluble lytic murein transglycosylase-like protein
MQLSPGTAQRFGVRNVFDPMENVRGGALYLKWLLDRFDGDLRLALAGYNAGENEVVRAGYRIPPIKETRDYVPKVLAKLSRPTPI